MLAFVLAVAGCVKETPAGQPIRSKPDLKEAARINNELGRSYASQGMLDLAETKFKKAIDEDSSIGSAHSGLGYIYWRRNEIAAAQSEYRRAVELNPADPEIRNDYGVFLCSQGHFEEGQQNIDVALKDPTYTTPAKGWTNAGLCAYQAKDVNAAEANFRKALQIDPNFPEALSELASLNYEQQNYLPARAFVERYLKAAAPTAPILLLGFNIEHALGDDTSAHEYELKLVRNFPDSDEAAKLLKQNSSAP
jgi:type IV pilus assembly protein PilF